MTRRPNDAGTVFEDKRRPGRWLVRLWVRGKRIERTAANEDAAKALLAKMLSDRDARLPIPPARLTVKQWLTEWLAGLTGVATSTKWRRGITVKRLLLPALGHLQLRDLSQRDIVAMHAELARAGYKPGTIGNAHGILSVALSAAVRLELLPRNVAKLVSRPRIPRHEPTVLTPAQLAKLLAAVAGWRLEALVVLLAGTGLRFGEAAALRWTDIDLDRGRIRLVRTVTQPKGGPAFSEGKTRGSRRAVPIGPNLVAALRAHRVRQAEERLAAGPAWVDDGLVFTGMHGGILANSTLRHALPGYCKAAGVPVISPHGLRHTAATSLLAAGVHPKIVSELLGHSSVTMTLDTYSHVLAGMSDAAVGVLDGMLAHEGTA
jgi:integrase